MQRGGISRVQGLDTDYFVTKCIANVLQELTVVDIQESARTSR